jgi:hypothetical protein
MVFLAQILNADEESVKGALSPLFLFVLAADLLQSLINEATHQGYLIGLLPLQHSPDFPLVQYADYYASGCTTNSFPQILTP